MTESTSCLTTTPSHLSTWVNAAKVGTIVPGTELKIVDPETGKEMGLNLAGELWTRGPQVAMGYLDNAKATADSFDSDGYLHTGDLGAIDEEGFVTIHDRIKEMIKVTQCPTRGKQIADRVNHRFAATASRPQN